MDPSGFEPESPPCKGGVLPDYTTGPIWNDMIVDNSKNYHFLFYIKKKEVIQPQVPLRLPCDDLTHLAKLRFVPSKKMDLT